MKQKTNSKRVYSRRHILSKFPLAFLGGLMLGTMLGKPLLSRMWRKPNPPVVPEGSIFTPAKDKMNEV
tara:strand:+ start:241 stop:444 length:204 start_codon:yes stop_codon:yes gene_type:complete